MFGYCNTMRFSVDRWAVGDSEKESDPQCDVLTRIRDPKRARRPLQKAFCAVLGTCNSNIKVVVLV